MPKHTKNTTLQDDAAPGFGLLLKLDRPALAAGGAARLQALVRIQAPVLPADAKPRPPLHLALVLDRSGSMSGEPLAEAVRCARNIIDSLAPGDRAAVFTFDDEVERVAGLTPAADKLALTAALGSIQSGGTTNLHGGWRAGADELADNLAGNDLHRVVLLSDGGANHGETDLEQISTQCKALAERGVSTSTYGLGRGFNEQLMLAMAAAGRGNAYYGQTAADLAEPFAAEFALLTSLCARGLVLKVKAPLGYGVELLNDYEPVEGEPRTWKLPDLAFASEAWAMLEFEVPADDCAVGQALALPVMVSVSAAALDSTPLFMMTGFPPLPVVDAAAREALPVDELVARRLLELAAGEALQQVRAAIEADDWKRAQQLADEAATRFAAHDWAAAVIAAMRRLIGERDKLVAMKEASYSRRNMNVRLASRSEKVSCEEGLLDVPAFLRRKPEQGKGRRDA